MSQELINTQVLIEDLNAYTPSMFIRGDARQKVNYERTVFLIEKIINTASYYFVSAQQSKIVEALYFAAEKHRGIYRKDEYTPYLLHVLEVVCILIDLQVFDFKIIVSAIIHDVVEDTDATKKDVQQRFGNTITRIVDLLTKHPNFIRRWGYWLLIRNEPDKNIRWRVIVIKFADRIHNIMTLNKMPKHKQISKTKETLEEFPHLYKVLVKTLRKLRRNGVLKKEEYLALPFRLNSILIHELSKYL